MPYNPFSPLVRWKVQSCDKETENFIPITKEQKKHSSAFLLRKRLHRFTVYQQQREQNSLIWSRFPSQEHNCMITEHRNCVGELLFVCNFGMRLYA